VNICISDDAQLQASIASRAENQIFNMAPVEVNVGGQIFVASENTLMKSPFLASLLGGELVDDMRDSHGRLFIDREPTLFAEVLRILRGHQPRSNETTSWHEVKAEADFYQVPLNLLELPAQVVLPPNILSVRRLYLEDQPPAEVSHRGPDDLCMYSLQDLPPDLKSQTSIIGVEVDHQTFGTKTLFLVRKQILMEAGFLYSRQEALWERTEQSNYHKRGGAPLCIPTHPTEVCREETSDYVCITYAVPPVSPIVTAGSAIVGVLHPSRSNS